MSLQQDNHDINDDEIRIITSQTASTPQAKSHKKSASLPPFLYIGLALIALALLIFGALYFFADTKTADEEELLYFESAAELPMETTPAVADGRKYVAMLDTMVNGVPLTILRPVNSRPRLHIGADILNDSDAVMVVQAADIRRDNGQIVGAFVKEGELISKGQAKSGFCAIVGGKLTIGVAESTPFLERALESGGYFFRQYPLVVANQIVENKLKNSALRKALAELGGETVVVMSRSKLTMHEFSQTLVDLGVMDAIYLVGSASNGFVVDSEGNRMTIGRHDSQFPENINYLVWY